MGFKSVAALKNKNISFQGLEPQTHHWMILFEL